MTGWKVAGLIALIVIVISVPLHALKESRFRTRLTLAGEREATFVGREACVPCHEEADHAWRGSDHDGAMAEANDSTVLGDFNDTEFRDGDIYAHFFTRDGAYYVRTEGRDGELTDFPVAYTMGIRPLQQYLIRFPGGRLQAFDIAWDVERRQWFSLRPDGDIRPGDWLHWTGGGQTWNGSCAGCHSTNVIKGYNAVSQTYSTTWSAIDVSCEACHGPGSRHVAWARVPAMARAAAENYELAVRTSDISARREVELCAPCHSRGIELGGYDHTQSQLLQTHAPALLDEGLYFADGQIQGDAYDYGSFVQSEMYREGVRCSDCHDVHSLKLAAEGNALCLRCHRATTYDAYRHHFHQKTVDGQPSDAARCISCHMPERRFLVIDRQVDHSMPVPRPDLTVSIGVPNACNAAGCHADQTAAWAANHYRRWYGESGAPHYGLALAAGRQDPVAAKPQLIQLAGDTLYPAIVRATALSLLPATGDEDVRETCARALKDREAIVRYTAARRLNAGAAELAQLLAPLLLDDAKAVRLAAAMRLAGAPLGSLQDYQREALDDALREFRQAMQHSLDFPFAEFNLGNLHLIQRDTAGAEPHFRAALALDDRFDPARWNLAIALRSMGRHAEADSLQLQLLADQSERHEAEYALGASLADRRRYEEAAHHLRRAAAGMPGRAEVHYRLGLVEQALGQEAAADAALRRALQLEPDDLEYQFALADHYVRRRQFDRALELADRMIASHPESEVGVQVKIFLQEIALKAASGIKGYGDYTLRGISDYRDLGRTSAAHAVTCCY